uniref:Ig-like domain-containing protein n=1 Tax=Periophthalmus magnuspinnatus TaxID=409849 RepID=A0A3B4BL69_9GOBI
MQRTKDCIISLIAPIRSLSMELSRLSGFEEIKCSVRNVFPPPRVTWSTEPPTFHSLQPLTRKQLEGSGLYEVDSRLRTLGQKDLIYICTATSPYSDESWSASYRHRGEGDLRGSEGKDLTLPCFAPSYLNSQTLSWTFSNSDAPKHILTYSVQSGEAVSSQEWAGHVELDGLRVQFGDGSVRLMDPEEEHHTGMYSCVFSTQRSTHTETIEVTISGTDPSYWWVVGLIVAILVVAVVIMLVYLKIRGNCVTLDVYVDFVSVIFATQYCTHKGQNIKPHYYLFETHFTNSPC